METLIRNQKITDFCKSIQACSLNKQFALGGLDLERSVFKFYAPLTETPSPAILNQLYGNFFADKFFEWNVFWDQKSSYFNSGLGLKFSANSKSTQYFHLKLKPEAPILFPGSFLFLKALNININSVGKGISYEIYPDGTYKEKFYVYVKNNEDIKKILNHKNILPNIYVKHIKKLEMYASDCDFKYNISCGSREDFIDVSKNFTGGPSSEVENSAIRKSMSNELKPLFAECTNTLKNNSDLCGGITSVGFCATGKTSVYFIMKDWWNFYNSDKTLT